MNEWIVQWNGNEPAWVNTRLCCASRVMLFVIVHEPSSRATLCGTESSLDQVITSPTAALTGPQALSATVAFTSAAAPDAGVQMVATTVAPGAPSVAAGGLPVAAGGLPVAAGGLPVAAGGLPEHAARSRAAASADVVRRMARIPVEPPGATEDRHDSATRRATPYGSAVGAIRVDDPELARRLVLHEARAQQAPSRELRDLGDGWLVFDENDAEPFWNRIIAPRWPSEPTDFDRRLDEVITLFATLDRLPHIRPLPLGCAPPDLASRLEAAGFERLGADRRMVLTEPARAKARLAAAEARVAAAFGRERVSISRHGDGAPLTAERPRWGERRRWASEASLALEDAFGVEPERRIALENDVLACVSRPRCSMVLLRVDDEPVAIARRASTGDGSYLSSIGTRPAFRGHGLGSLATALVLTDSLEAGSPVVHLSVDLDNHAGRRLYESLGFAVVGEPAPDMLLR